MYGQRNENPQLGAPKSVVRAVNSQQFARFRVSFSAEMVVNARVPSEDKSDESEDGQRCQQCVKILVGDFSAKLR